MLLPWLVETRMLCWKAAIEEALMFTLDGIDTQFTSEWTGLDIVKENYKLFFKQCTLPLRKMPNFLAWKFCEKAYFPRSFGWTVRNSMEYVPFHKISAIKNYVKIWSFTQCSLFKLKECFLKHLRLRMA